MTSGLHSASCHLFFQITILLCLLSSSSVVPSCAWRPRRRVSAAGAAPRCCRRLQRIQTKIRVWGRSGGCWPSYWHPWKRWRGGISSRGSSGCCRGRNSVHVQIRRSSSCGSLSAFSDLLLLLALLLASVVGTLPHGEPPLGVRGRFGVVVFGQFS